jgi:protein disulfide-isomerase
MNKRIMWVALVAGLMSVGSSFAADDWTTDFAGAQKTAAEKNLPILVDFSGSDWCGWCIKLDKEVFSQKEFKEFAQGNVVLFLADFPRGKSQSAELKKQNKGLMEKYGVQGFPTVLLLNAKGDVIGETGYQPGGARKYVAHLKDLLKKKG